jgi:hypothetical protein
VRVGSIASSFSSPSGSASADAASSNDTPCLRRFEIPDPYGKDRPEFERALALIDGGRALLPCGGRNPGSRVTVVRTYAS